MIFNERWGKEVPGARSGEGASARLPGVDETDMVTSAKRETSWARRASDEIDLLIRGQGKSEECAKWEDVALKRNSRWEGFWRGVAEV